MRGGHARSGPAVLGAKERTLRGTKQRSRHTAKGRSGRVVADLAPPPSLTDEQRPYWTYYAQRLAEEGRLTLKTRDALAGYCVALWKRDRLLAQMHAAEFRDVTISVTVDGAGSEHVTAKTNPLNPELRQWMAICRSYENDLILNPATAVRTPVTQDDDRGDEFTEFEGLRGIRGGKAN